MGFNQGLSGLNGAARNLDVIGNNIANTSTAGFKMGRAEFADLYATALTGAVGQQIGIGAQVADITQQFTQGNITTTNNPLDLAISNNGFFRMDQNGVINYQRNGQFQLDKDGYIVNNTGQNLTGYSADPTTGAVTSATDLGKLRVSTADLAPVATTKASIVANLDATKTAPTAAFSPATPASFNDTTSITVYDSLGNEHALSLYFRKTATPNEWDVYGAVKGTQIGAAALGKLAFNNDGTLDLTVPTNTTFPSTVNIPVTTGAVTPIPVALDFSSTTQFGSAFGVTSISQDGYASGKLAGFGVDKSGVITGRYTNSQTKELGMVALASFANPQGLTAIGNNQWVETADSGQALVGAPGSGTLGLLQSGAVEDSNVDLTAELINMIVAQRMYQANAQTIKTQDSILQTLVNLR